MATTDRYQGICIPWRYLSTGLWETFSAATAGMVTMVAVTPQLVMIQAVIAGALVGAAVRALIAVTLHRRDRQSVHMNASRALLYAEQLIAFAQDLRFLGASTRAGKLRQCSQDLLTRVYEDPSASVRQRTQAAWLLTTIGVDDPESNAHPTSAASVTEPHGA